MAKTDPKTPSTETAVAQANPNAGAVINPEDYAAYAGSGFENQTADDYAIPFLGILQALSPQCTEDPEKFRQGMIVNTVTGELFDGKKGIVFVPALTEHLYVEWKDRKAGGGFVGVHQPADEFVRRCLEESAKRNLPYGKVKTGPEELANELIETFYVYGVLVDGDGNSSEAVLAFNSTKIKVYKGWMTKAKTIQIALADGRRIPAPLFAHRYRLTTVSEKNAKGQFYNWTVGFDGDNAVQCRLAPNDPLFQQAVNVKTLIQSGKARAAHETAGGSADTPEDGGAGAPDASGKAKPVF